MSNIYNDTGDFTQSCKSDFSSYIHAFTELCGQDSCFDSLESLKIIQQLNKLNDYREYFGNKDHPSLPKILSDIGNSISTTSSSLLAIPFFMEQLRIEKRYLGCNHPDLASVLFSIGQVYENNDRLIEATKYLTDALCLLNQYQRKGQVYALIVFHLGLVNYRQSLYKGTMEYFDLAIIEYKTAHGKFHSAVAEILLKIGSLQLDIGKLQDAMDNFLQALVIIRMAYGNDHSKVAECLYGIGLIHEARTEYSESLNVMSQALGVNENAYDDDDDTFSLVILHRIGMIYQSMEDIDKANKVFENLKNMIAMKGSDDDSMLEQFNFFGFSFELLPPGAAAA